MSNTSTQIPTFVPEPDELLEPLGRGGEDVWARLKALRFDGAALLSRFIPGTGLREVKSWRKRPGAIDAVALEVLDALRPIISEKDPRQLDYHRVVRAMILQRLGRHDDAASIYVGIFEGN